MNYYMPRQRQDNGLWHYTRRNDGDIWPVAGCSPWETCPDCKGDSFYALRDVGYGAPTDCERCENKGVIEKAEPCAGHWTAEGARQHAAQHVIEEATFDHQWADWCGCEAEGCDQPTKQYARTGHPDQWSISLCAAHLNRETVAAIVGDQLGDIISSS